MYDPRRVRGEQILVLPSSGSEVVTAPPCPLAHQGSVSRSGLVSSTDYVLSTTISFGPISSSPPSRYSWQCWFGYRQAPGELS